MRLVCPKCGAKGDSRMTKTPKWRCSPARSNGGCGYEWDAPLWNEPDVDYRDSVYMVVYQERRARNIRALGGGEVGLARYNLLRSQGHVTLGGWVSEPAPPPPAAPIPPPPPPAAPEPTPNITNDKPYRNPKGSLVERIGGMILVYAVLGLFIAIIIWAGMTFGGGGNGGGDGYKEECRMEDRGGRIREVCW